MNRIFKIKFIFLMFIMLSCSSSKNVVLLQQDVVDLKNDTNNYQLFFKPDDLLRITVSSNDLLSVQPFNLPVASFSANTNNAVGQPVL